MRILRQRHRLTDRSPNNRAIRLVKAPAPTLKEVADN